LLALRAFIVHFFIIGARRPGNEKIMIRIRSVLFEDRQLWNDFLDFETH